MQRYKRILLNLLISYAIVLGVNLTANFKYYAAGNEWRYSVFFCIGITSLGWLGYVLIYELTFKKRMDGKKNMRFDLLYVIVICAVYGVVLMLAAIKLMKWCCHLNYDNYVENCLFSALFSIVIGLMVTGQEFLTRLKSSLTENEQMKQEMLRSQFEALKNQVNPHFLFNSLNTLIAIIPEKPDTAVNFVQQLSKVFRYSLQYSGENTIDLASELKVVESYLFLNQQRYDGKLLTNIHVSDMALQKQIITQSLLMVVENAVKHNEISNLNPLSVEIYDEQDKLVVKNSLQRKNIPEASTHIGLDNIVKRYELVTGSRMEVTEENNQFIVKLPLL